MGTKVVGKAAMKAGTGWERNLLFVRRETETARGKREGKQKDVEWQVVRKARDDREKGLRWG